MQTWQEILNKGDFRSSHRTLCSRSVWTWSKVLFSSVVDNRPQKSNLTSQMGQMGCFKNAKDQVLGQAHFDLGRVIS